MLRRLVIWSMGLAFLIAAVPTPAFATDSAIETRYENDYALAAHLGSPTGSEFSVADGRQRNYQWGSLFWSDDTGVHEVHGSILWKYRQVGGPEEVGFPTTDEYDLWVRYQSNVIGKANDFEDGTIGWSSAKGPKWLSTPLADEWLGNVTNLLMPNSDEYGVANARKVNFDSGAIYSSSAGGTHVMWDSLRGHDIAITHKWNLKGGSGGLLGPPTSNLIDRSDGTYQLFRWGRIYWKGDYEADEATPEGYEVHGAILSRFLSAGGIGTFGYPTTDELTIPGGKVSRFENAEIRWSASTGATTIVWD